VGPYSPHKVKLDGHGCPRTAAESGSIKDIGALGVDLAEMYIGGNGGIKTEVAQFLNGRSRSGSHGVQRRFAAVP
jgi:nitrite reductase (NADH) large subunit